MDRIKQATPATITNDWQSGGVLIDPGTVTIGITSVDGTVVVPAGTAVTGAGAAARSFNLTAAHTILLDSLVATWTTTNAGIDFTYHEIVGDHLFTIAEARAAGLVDGSYSEAQIREKRTSIERRLEDAMGVSFFPRYMLEAFGSERGYVVQPHWAFPRVIRNVWRDSATVTPVASAVTIDEGAFRFSWGWSYAYETVRVGYEHGYLTVPEYVRLAALEEAKQSLQAGSSGMDPRVASYSTDDGSVRFFEGATASGFVSTQMNQIVQNDSMRVMIA